MTTNFDPLLAHYCRYVDDIFCVFDCLENVFNKISFHQQFTSKLKFTHEIGPKQLAFQDTFYICLQIFVLFFFHKNN